MCVVHVNKNYLQQHTTFSLVETIDYIVNVKSVSLAQATRGVEMQMPILIKMVNIIVINAIGYCR
jgi:hypothetical protein